MGSAEVGYGVVAMVVVTTVSGVTFGVLWFVAPPLLSPPAGRDEIGQPVEGSAKLLVDVLGRGAAVVAGIVAEEGQVPGDVAGAALGRGDPEPVARTALPAPFQPNRSPVRP
jgi:hypothetical protein